MTAQSVSTGESFLRVAALSAADWLRFAATPIFVVMAMLAGIHGDSTGMADMPGMSSPASSPLTGMVAMYVLMSVFHLAPWLKLIAGRRS